MDFLSLIKRKERLINPKIILIFVVVGVILVLISFFYKKTPVNIINFLPPETDFFYYWTEREAFDNNYLQQNNFIDQETPKKHLQFIRNTLQEGFLGVSQVIWFKNLGQEAYLIYFDKQLSRDFFNNLENNNPDYYFIRDHQNVLLITNSQDIKNAFSSQANDKFFPAIISQGINVYYDADFPPNFLLNFHNQISTLISDQEIFINFYNRNNSLASIEVLINSQELDSQFSVFNNILIPPTFDLAASYSPKSIQKYTELINNDFIPEFFTVLPQYNLDWSSIHDDIIIFQDQNNWLLASLTDFKDLIPHFIDNFALQEIKKYLPDGTTYIELVMKEEFDIEEHFDFEQKYWQSSGLFGFALGDYFYLSNNLDLVKTVMSSSRTLDSLVRLCETEEQRDYWLTDFLYVSDVELLPENLKTYFQNRQINNLFLFSYKNLDFQGLKVCF